MQYEEIMQTDLPGEVALLSVSVQCYSNVALCFVIPFSFEFSFLPAYIAAPGWFLQHPT